MGEALTTDSMPLQTFNENGIDGGLLMGLSEVCVCLRRASLWPTFWAYVGALLVGYAGGAIFAD